MSVGTSKAAMGCSSGMMNVAWMSEAEAGAASSESEKNSVAVMMSGFSYDACVLPRFGIRKATGGEGDDALPSSSTFTSALCPTTKF